MASNFTVELTEKYGRHSLKSYDSKHSEIIFMLLKQRAKFMSDQRDLDLITLPLCTLATHKFYFLVYFILDFLISATEKILKFIFSSTYNDLFIIGPHMEINWPKTIFES